MQFQFSQSIPSSGGLAGPAPEDSSDADDSVTSEGKATGQVVVVKIGGSTLGTNDTTLLDLVALQSKGLRPVVVHGGGKIISEWLERQGIRPKFVRGLRVTDDKTLDVVVAVLTGLVNKSLVSEILALGGKAVGLSGVDGGLLKAEVDSPELGHVGRVTGVDPSGVSDLVSAGCIPVIAPVALNGTGTSPKMLNVNADLAAGEVAAALGADRLLMLTDVPGVLDSSKRLIPRLTERQARGLMASRIVAGGMIPKIEACLKALSSGSNAHIVDGRRPHILLENLADAGASVPNAGRSLGTRVG
jgi:acetylglutamate kinase